MEFIIRCLPEERLTTLIATVDLYITSNMFGLAHFIPK